MNDPDIVRRTDIINRLLDRSKPLRGLIHVDDVIRTINVAPSVNPPEREVLDKIKGYVDHIRNTGMGKKKSLEFIEKFIEGLKAESEEVWTYKT